MFTQFQAGDTPRRRTGIDELADIEADILEAERRLQELIPNHGPRSFCYPCYATDVGEGVSRQSYVPVIARHFVAGRGGGEYGFFNHPYNCDLHCLLGASGQQMTAAQLIGLAELALSQGRWAIFTFHGIDTGRLGTAQYDFSALLDHLSANRERIWVAPVRDVASHLIALRNAFA